jgi:hypothetical protein
LKTKRERERERLTVKDVEESGRGLISCIIRKFAWSDCGKPGKI